MSNIGPQRCTTPERRVALVLELRDLVGRYRSLEREFEGITVSFGSACIQTLSESILDHRECLAEIQQMHARMEQISDDWQTFGNQLDPESHREAQELLAAGKTLANRIRQMCNILTQRLQAARDKLGQSMEELNKGREFLKSIKPVKNNYPKFIDSEY